MKSTIMSYSSLYGWQILPGHIFGDIIVMVGLNKLQRSLDCEKFCNKRYMTTWDSDEDSDRCKGKLKNTNNLQNLQKTRQVCQSWNIMISRSTKHKKDTIRSQTESQAARIREEWITENPFLTPHLPMHLTAAYMASHGLLGSVKKMILDYVDLAFVPAEHLAALASCVTDHVEITWVGISDLSPILENVKSGKLTIHGQSLSREETEKLVWIMDSNLQHFYLGSYCSLDIKTLTQYNGQGTCWSVCDAENTYRNEVISWGQRINWIVRSTIGGEYEGWSHITRKEEWTKGSPLPGLDEN